MIESTFLGKRKAGSSSLRSRWKKEYVFLSYFENQGIDFCPKAIVLDKANGFLIESYLEGEEVSQKDFSPEQIDEFASNLHKLFSLNVSGFSDFCEQNQYKKYTYTDPIESFEMYGLSRYEEAKRGNLSADIMSWFDKTLEENLNYLKSLDISDKTVGFAWGDIESAVIVNNSGKLFFYDFEHAEITNSFGLTYIKIHGKFSSSQFDYLLDRCAYYFKREKQELLLEITANEKIIRTNDAVWAAMKWSETKDKEFESLMYRRIDLVKNLPETKI